MGVNPTAQRLGLRPGERALIVTCNDFGMAHAANVGTFEALREGVATSASLMVPAPWARDAAARYRGEDVGVHLTLNAEHDRYRWGPITQAPSLLDGDGGFPRTVHDVWEHADLDEVRREWRAQVERAVLWGFDVSHLDAHLGGVELKPEFFDVYLDLAEEFALPVRLRALEDERLAGFPFRALAAQRGVIAPDRVLTSAVIGPGRSELAAALGVLPDGVSELELRPAADTPELRAATADWERRVADRALLLDGTLAELVAAEGFVLLGYRELRDLMR